MISERELKRFLALQKTIRGYEPEKKIEFHRLGHKLMFTLAAGAGYTKPQFEIRHCEGGIGVPGEIILHTDNLYAQLSDVQFGMLYRTVTGRTDYTGGPNRWMPWDKMADVKQVYEDLRVFVERHTLEKMT